MAALLLAGFADETVAFLPAGALESFRSDLGLTYAQAGAVVVLIGPGALLGNVATVAADVVSRRAIATVGAAGYAGALALFAAGDGLAALAGASLLLGASSTAMVDATEIALADVAGDQLPAYLARGNLLAVAGDVCGPLLLVGVAAAGWSWRVAFWAGASLMLVYAIWLSTLPMPAPRPDRSDGGQRGAIVAVARDRGVWLLAGISTLVVALDEPFLGFLIAFLERVRGLGSAPATMLATTTVAGGALAFVGGAAVLRRIGDARALVGAGAVLAVSAGALVVVRDPVLLAFPGATFGAAMGMTWLIIQHRMLTIRPGRAGAVMAFVGTAEVAGYAVPVGIGAVADAHGLTAGLLLYAILPVAILLLADLALSQEGTVGVRGQSATSRTDTE